VTKISFANHFITLRNTASIRISRLTFNANWDVVVIWFPDRRQLLGGNATRSWSLENASSRLTGPTGTQLHLRGMDPVPIRVVRSQLTGVARLEEAHVAREDT